MTTVAVKDGVMAADTRVTDAGPFWHEDKIFRVGSSLFGTAGHGSLCLVLLDWLRTPRNRDRLYKQIPPEYRDDVRLLELNPGGLVIWDGWGAACRLHDKMFAIGSGAPAALAAMRGGDTAEQAVKVAIGCDEASGPPVQVLSLKPKRKR